LERDASTLARCIIRIKERLTFSFGASAFNIANHPNLGDHG